MRAHPDVAGQPLSGSTRTAARVSEKVAVSVVFVAAMFMSIMDETPPGTAVRPTHLLEVEMCDTTGSGR
jgi:hypothetical protein